jgi:hypothetical protein
MKLGQILISQDAQGSAATHLNEAGNIMQSLLVIQFSFQWRNNLENVLRFVKLQPWVWWSITSLSKCIVD